MSNTQTQNAPKKESKMLFLEQAQWKKGQAIITILVTRNGNIQEPVGFIYLHEYDENKKPVFISYDAGGNEIFPKSGNLYQLKLEYRAREEELIKKMLELIMNGHSDQPKNDKEISEQGKTNPPQQQTKNPSLRKNGKNKQQQISL